MTRHSEMKNSSYAARLPAAFEELDKLKNADGLVAIISRRISNGTITFAIKKEFERDGAIEQTSFISEHMMASYLDLVKRVEKRIPELKAKAPPPAHKRTA